MFWETVAALMLVVCSFPFWLIAAVLWGFAKAAMALVGMLMQLNDLSALDGSDLIAIPLAAVFQGLAAAWSVPVAVWDWAKFEHPIWAAVIAVVLAAGSSSRRG